MGKVTFYTKLGREVLVLGVLGSIVQREGLATPYGKLLETVDDSLIRLSSAFPGKLGNENKPALALGQRI